MVNDNTFGGIVAALILSLIIISVETGILVKVYNHNKPIADAITECEKNIPRNQYCKIVFSTEVVK